MSDPTPPSPTPPRPSPIPVFNWQAIFNVLLTGIAAFLYGMHNGGTTPAPNPSPVPDDGQHKTSPQPVPVPTAIITIKDADGNVIANSVDVGDVFTVSVPVGVSVIGNPLPNAKSASIDEISDSLLACALKPGGSIQLIAYGGDKRSIVMVTANHAPQPPPDPSPKPQPSPTPDPSPKPDPNPTPVPTTVKNVSIAIVEDGLNRPPFAAKVLNDFATWSKYKSAGNDWILYNYTTKESKGVAAVAALKTSNVPIPPGGIVIYDKSNGVQLYAGPLPQTIDGVTALVNQYTGGSL